PKQWPAFFDRALAYADQSHDDQALRDLNAALGISPGNADVLEERGEVYSGLEDYVSAIRDFDAAIVARPGFALAYTQRADAKEKSGDAAGAASDRDRAKELGRKAGS
ncbi:MAG: hypothetical protein ABSA49_06695, partial [Rhizomicrobium sp.]